MIVLVIVVALGWAIEGNNFAMIKYFSPKREAVRRQVFEESHSYNAGTWQSMRKYQLEYVKATPSQKDAIASIALQEINGYDEAKLPADVRAFVNELRGRSLGSTPTGDYK